EYDDLGRTIKTIEADGETEERWTLTQYDGLSNVTKQIADPDRDDTHSGGIWTTDSDSQVTVYSYEDTYDASLVTKITYPDSADGDDVVTIAYHLDGSTDTRIDQRGVEMTYSYDNLRRLVSQRITDFDSHSI